MWASTWTYKSSHGYICFDICIYQWKSDLKDASYSEEVIDQNTDSDVECEESLLCAVF